MLKSQQANTKTEVISELGFNERSEANQMIEFKRVDEKLGEMICYKVQEHLTLDDLMQEFRCFLLALGYQPGSIDNYIEAN